MYLIGTPVADASEKCNQDSFAFHEGEDGPEALFLSETQEDVVNFATDALSLGNFTLGQLSEAFHGVEMSPNLGEGFDIITSNCASFVMKMASGLGLDIDGRIMAYNARRLASARGNFVARLVRKSPNLPLLVGDAESEDVPDFALMDLLVRRYVDEYYREEKEREQIVGEKNLEAKQRTLNSDNDDLGKKIAHKWFQMQAASVKEKYETANMESGESRLRNRRFLSEGKDKWVSQGSHFDKSYPGPLFQLEQHVPRSHSNHRKLGKAGKGDKSDPAVVECELDIPPLDGYYFYFVEFTTTGPGRVDFEITCDGEPAAYDDWELLVGDAVCTCTIDSDAGPGITFGSAGTHLMTQDIICPGDSKLEIEITNSQVVEKIVIKEANCLGSLTDITAVSPSGSLYTTDLGLVNGDERFMWDFEDGEQVGTYLTVGCLDLNCPTNLPRERLSEVYEDEMLCFAEAVYDFYGLFGDSAPECDGFLDDE